MRSLPFLFLGAAACASAPVSPVTTRAAARAPAPSATLLIDEIAGLGLFHD